MPIPGLRPAVSSATSLARAVVWGSALAPLVWLAHGALTDGLGANPIDAVQDTLGRWALRFLLAALAVTPVRRMMGLGFVAPLRRLLGLWAFAYACLHITLWVAVDHFFDWGALAEAVAKRPWVTAGAGAFLALVPLAATSTAAMTRRLGARAWRRLHRLAYVAAVLAVLHFWWLAKVGVRDPWLYALVLALLLAARVLDRQLGGLAGPLRRLRWRAPRPGRPAAALAVFGLLAGLAVGPAAAPASADGALAAEAAPMAVAAREVAELTADDPAAGRDGVRVQDADADADAADTEDLLAPLNEAVFALNRVLDQALVRPLAAAFGAVVSPEGQRMVASAFDNLRWVPRAVNSLLQGKPEGALREAARFLINTTAGALGAIDVAREHWGIEPSDEDFGQTLGVWGADAGPYLVLPLFGPSSARDAVGAAVDAVLDPLSWLVPFQWTGAARLGAEAVSTRAIRGELYDAAEASAVDLYAAVRQAYLVRRARLVRD